MIALKKKVVLKKISKIGTSNRKGRSFVGMAKKNNELFIKNRFKKSIYLRKKYQNLIKIKNFSNRTFRIFDSIVERRVKIVKRLINLNTYAFNTIIFKYNSFRWLKDLRLVWGLKKYKKDKESLESQGLKRKFFKRKLKIYAIALLDKQKLKSYYIGLKEYSLKEMVTFVFSKKVNSLNIFVLLLESRLLSFLQRTNLFRTNTQIKIFLKLGFVLINNVVVKNFNYFLKNGDKVSFSYIPKNKIAFASNLKKRFSLFYYPTRYIEISFSLMIFLYYRSPSLCDLVYPFTVNLSRILYYYNYKGLR
jgi:ribosomal protein S4